jgi:hypothetical protein
MARKHSTLWAVTILNVGAAMVTVGALIYIQGISDGQSKPEVRVPVISPQRVIANPHVGRGLHPNFDCSALSRVVTATSAQHVAIGELANHTKDYENQSVNVRAVVVQGFPQIMGTNWFHLYDRPSGKVLVVSSTEWAQPGSGIVVTGTLSIDRNIGGAYLFPLFLENADLEGSAVEERQSDRPQPTYFL